MNYEPPVPDDIDFSLHDPNESFLAAGHEMGQHSETCAGAGASRLVCGSAAWAILASSARSGRFGGLL
jgi:hypothetical protein